jgi:integrase
VKQGISAQTFNFHLAVKQFCRWMVKHGRATANPVDALEPLNVKVDRRRDRRALTVDELCNLLHTTAAGPVRGRMTGAVRALLYRVAMETGLRSNELRTLTVRSFALDTPTPTVTVAAGNSKNRREDTLPIRPELVDSLRPLLAGREGDEQVFSIPKDRKCAAKMFRADVDAAGIVFRDDAKEVVDCHALRHTFITNLARGTVHPKIAQALARHSTITLTMDRYTHSDLGEQADALNVLPNPLTAGGTKPVHLASCLASKHAKQGTAVDSGGLSNKSRGDGVESSRRLEKQGDPQRKQGERECIGIEPTGGVVHTPHRF